MQFTGNTGGRWEHWGAVRARAGDEAGEDGQRAATAVHGLLAVGSGVSINMDSQSMEAQGQGIKKLAEQHLT